DSFGGGINFGYPIDENQSVSLGLNIDQTEVTTGPYVSTYVADYLERNNGKETKRGEYCPGKIEIETGRCLDSNDSPIDTIPYGQEFKGEFLTYNLNLGWSYNTLNRPVFPTTGMSHRVNAEIALPGSDVEYQKVS